MAQQQGPTPQERAAAQAAWQARMQGLATGQIPRQMPAMRPQAGQARPTQQAPAPRVPQAPSVQTAAPRQPQVPAAQTVAPQAPSAQQAPRRVRVRSTLPPNVGGTAGAPEHAAQPATAQGPVAPAQRPAAPVQPAPAQKKASPQGHAAPEQRPALPAQKPASSPKPAPSQKRAPAPKAVHPAQPAPAGHHTAAAHRGTDVMYIAMMAVFGVAFLVSAGMLINRFISDRKAEGGFSSMRQRLAVTPPPVSDAEQPEENPLVALHEENPDLIGWISIEGTDIDYPVMYKPDSEDYYLRRDVNGEYSRYGVPYIEERCTLTDTSHSNNLIIYGHHMKTGTMFSSLIGYKKADFYAEHPIVEFDTIYGAGRYEVFAAFAVDVVLEADFVYDTYTDLSPQMFDWFVQEAISRSDVDTGIRPQYGEELITLSTCEYSTDNGRYVVCARRLP